MGYATKDQLKVLCKGKTDAQKKTIEYFCKQPGCMSKIISDSEYLQLVEAKKKQLDLRKKALQKIGLDESEVSEIKPAMFEGFYFKNAYAKQVGDRYVSSSYQVAWLFFSSTQVYIFRCTFNMDDDKRTESTDEFFYKDVTSFSTSSETEESKAVGGNKIEVTSNKFCMVVPGDKLYVAMDGVADSEAIIQAMKQKLREKKM